MVVGVKGTGSIEERAGEMDRWLKDKLPKGTGVNFVAHSMVSRLVLRVGIPEPIEKESSKG